MLTKRAQKIYDFLKTKYVKEGYCFSGSISINTVISILDSYDNSGLNNVLDELEGKGIIQQSNDQAFAIELTAKERRRLVELHKLEEVWSMDKSMCAVPPTSEEGEITKLYKLSNSN